MKKRDETHESCWEVHALLVDVAVDESPHQVIVGYREVAALFSLRKML